jgi:hypothetical protein
VSYVFVSHASADDTFVAGLRRALEELGIPVWVDSRALRGGSRLKPEIKAAIEGARQVRQFVAKHRAFTEPALRKLIFEAAPRFQTVGGRCQPVPDNGMGIALLRVGRRILIDEALFFEWLGKHRAAGPRRLALEVPARRRVAGERI